MQLQDLEDHLRGHKTYGIYLLRADSTVTTAVIDADLAAAFREGRGAALREKRILYQTLSFLPRRKQLLHYLLAQDSEYNVHEVDFRISKVRGTPLGCRRIHSLLNFSGDYCRFEPTPDYSHPLLHVAEWRADEAPRSETVDTLQEALTQLAFSIDQVRRLL